MQCNVYGLELMVSYTGKRDALILHLKFQKFLIGDTRTSVHRLPPPVLFPRPLPPMLYVVTHCQTIGTFSPAFTRTDMRTSPFL